MLDQAETTLADADADAGDSSAGNVARAQASRRSRGSQPSKRPLAWPATFA